MSETYLELEKFYTLKSILQNRSYVIYVCKVYDDEMMQLNISLNKNVLSWYIGNNNVRDDNSNFPNIISYEQNGIIKNQLKLTYNDGVYEIYNLNTQIPMYINGIYKEYEKLRYGDSIFILGLRLSIIKDIFLYK